MEEACLATGDLAVPARPATKKLSGRKLAMRIMLGALGASVVLGFAGNKTAHVLTGAVFSALLKSDSFKALVRETVLDVLKSPEGQALLAKAAQK